MQAAKHLSITGRVQGVGYRAWFTGKARKAGFTGWVRNRRDGTVEAVIAGDVAQIELFIAECWEGPLAARVDGIEATDALVPDTVEFLRLETI